MMTLLIKIPTKGANKAVKPVALIVRCLLTVVSVVTRQFGSLYLHNLVSPQSPRGTRSSSIATLSWPESRNARNLVSWFSGKLLKLLPPGTRCQILRLKCTKFEFGWGSAPDHAVGAYSAPPSWI